MNNYNNIIGGKEVKSKKTFTSFNPFTEQPIAKFQASNIKDVDKAVSAARAGYKKWSKIPAPKRGEILLEIASILKKRKLELAKLESTEMGKILQEGLGDVQEAIDIFEYMAGEGRRLFGHTTPSELKHKACYTVKQPLGVVGIITPWNFPIAIPAWKIAPALICGNGIVFKPSSDTPLCAYKLVKICEEAGVPKGVINFITGSGSEVGTPIIKHNKIDGVSFTGSRSVGEFVTQNAGLKKVGLELGGKNPIIIMDDADLKSALDGVIFASFGTTGQRCTAASRIIVHKNIFKEFEETLIKKVKKLKMGNPLKSSTNIGPLINRAAVEKTHKYTEIGIKEKAKLLCGGSSPDTRGFFYKPTVFTNVKPNMRIAQEEIFGPTTALIKINNIKEAINIANNVDYGLSSSIYTNDLSNAYLFIENTESGLAYVNAPTIGAEVHLPFGGTKNTGNGTREAGIEGIHEFSETKTVYIDYSNKLQKAQGIR